MSREAMQMALDALESNPATHAGLISRKQAIAALRQALVDADDMSQKRVDGTVKCKHEWVGLTDEEFKFIASKYSLPTQTGMEYFKDELEAKLKEKNT